MGKFSFNGVTIVAPGFILRSSIGTQRAAQILPFGKILMMGTSEGGLGNGTIYDFPDLNVGRAVLRSGALLEALELAGRVGGAAGFVAVVVGTKTSASKSITGTDGSSLTLTAGDAGPWTNQIQYEIQNGTNSGFAFTLQYPDPDGNIITVGGPGSPYYDNLPDVNALSSAILNDSLLTPGTATGLQPIVIPTVVQNGVPTNTSGLKNLSGGTGASEYVNTTVLASSGATPAPTTTACAVADVDGIEVGTVLWDTTIVPPEQITVTGVTDGLYTTVAASPAPTTVSCALTDPTGALVGATVAINGTNSVITSITGASNNVIHFAGRTLPVAGQSVVEVPQITYSAVSTAPSGSDVLTSVAFADFQTGIDECVNEAFDIGHLVNGYDSVSQAYADQLSLEVEPLARLQRWIHQVIPTGTSPTATKAANSTAVVNAGTTRAMLLDNKRASVVAQRTNAYNPDTGVQELVDLAPIICGYAALVGASGANGPATALTYDSIPTCISLDYEVLGTNNSFISPTGTDLDRAILGGMMPFTNLFPNGVRCVQSVTTAPNDANGNPWIYAEFSIVRVVDAVAANIKAGIESMNPKGLGVGLTVKAAGHILATVHEILVAAQKSHWITAYNKSAIQFQPIPGSPTDAKVLWDMVPVFPLNHLALDQTVQPFSVTVQQITGGA